MATTTLFVLVVLAVFNFLASIIQGVAGVGDAIFLMVLWYIACEMDHETFLSTPLGTEPIPSITILMYIRFLFITPLVVYLGFSESVFSKTMTIAMAVSSTLFAIIGVYLFTCLNGDRLKTVFGVSSLLFAIVYACILLLRVWQRRRTLQQLKQQNVKVVVEANALADDLHRSRNASITELQNRFMLHVPNNRVIQLGNLLNTCALHNIGEDERNAETKHKPIAGIRTFVNTISINTQLPSQVQRPTSSIQDSKSNTTRALETLGNKSLYHSRPPVMSPEIHEETGRLPANTEEELISTITGDVFVPQEAVVPHVCEEHVPVLTPSKLSPSRTMTFTRVRINRNLDSSGHIKLATKVGAAVAASLSGLMASLIGVNAPPQIIFILLFNTPSYLVRVNFSAQAIPANLIRVVMAANQHLFKWDQAPLFIVSIVFGYAGVFVGHHIGRVLGPKSYDLFVLCLLLLSVMVMITSSVTVLLFTTFLIVIATGVSARVEMVKNKPIIVAQREAEMEIEKRIYDVMEFLERNQNNNNNNNNSSYNNNDDITHSTSLHDNEISCHESNNHNNINNNDDNKNIEIKPAKSTNKDSFVLNRPKREVCTYSASRPKLLWNNFDNDDDTNTASSINNNYITTTNRMSNESNESGMPNSVHEPHREREMLEHDTNNNNNNNSKNRESKDNSDDSYSKPAVNNIRTISTNADANSNNSDRTNITIATNLNANTDKSKNSSNADEDKSTTIKQI